MPSFFCGATQIREPVMLYGLLGNKRKRRIREIARQCLVDTRNRKDAIAMVRRRIKKEMVAGIVGIVLARLMTELAIRLINYWIVNQFSSPERGAFIHGEPGG